MTAQNDLAFPFVETAAMQGESISFGLTKREIFAAMAMQGILSSWPAGSDLDCCEAAKQAVDHADALMVGLE